MIQMIKSSAYLVYFTQTLQRSLVTLVTLVTVIGVHPSYHRNAHSYPSRGMQPSIWRGIPERHSSTNHTKEIFSKSIPFCYDRHTWCHGPKSYISETQAEIHNQPMPTTIISCCMPSTSHGPSLTPSVTKSPACGWQANSGVSRCGETSDDKPLSQADMNGEENRAVPVLLHREWDSSERQRQNSAWSKLRYLGDWMIAAKRSGCLPRWRFWEGRTSPKGQDSC